MRNAICSRRRGTWLATSATVMALSAAAAAQTRQIDLMQSKLVVYVYKSGLFSGFAGDHIIDAPLAGGTLSDEAPLSVAIEVRAADLKVRDPNLSASKREEVQMRMLSPQVLDTAKFQTITFESTSIEPAGAERWNVTGRLMIHGQTKPVTFTAARANGHYRGTATVKQRDFGITPISIAGGTVKVKDELKIEFDIVPR
jgi:polyisoprenoid-binding protein YceI